MSFPFFFPRCDRATNATTRPIAAPTINAPFIISAGSMDLSILSITAINNIEALILSIKFPT